MFLVGITRTAQNLLQVDLPIGEKMEKKPINKYTMPELREFILLYVECKSLLEFSVQSGLTFGKIREIIRALERKNVILPDRPRDPPSKETPKKLDWKSFFIAWNNGPTMKDVFLATGIDYPLQEKMRDHLRTRGFTLGDLPLGYTLTFNKNPKVLGARVPRKDNLGWIRHPAGSKDLARKLESGNYDDLKKSKVIATESDVQELLALCPDYTATTADVSELAQLMGENHAN